jgi:hypothetical protein
MTSTRTPLFRIALTIAVLWIGFATFQGWEARNAVQSHTFGESYDTAAADCAEITDLAPGAGLNFVTKPNPDHIGCLERVNRLYAGYEADEKHRVTIAALKRALIPAAVLLLLAAFYRQIASALALATARYVRWIKGGTSSDTRNPE